MEVCPRCQKEFVCLAEDIAECPCTTVKIPEKVYRYTSEKYKTCLCLNCLQELEKQIEFEGEANNPEERQEEKF